MRRVTGDSMLPALTPGAIVVGVWPRKLSAGDVVIVHHGGLDKIKRAREVRPGELFLEGDNSLHSTDSRSFGWLPTDVLLAKVIWPRNLNRARFFRKRS